MPETLYDAHPSLIRNKPLGVPFTILAMLFGIVVAIAGPSLIGMSREDPMARTVQIAGLVILVLAFFTLLIWWMRTRMDHLEIKKDEIVWTNGLINKQYTEIGMTSVRTVRVEQNLLDRLLGVGSLTIFTAGDRPELVVHGMPDPSNIRELIQAQGRGSEAAA